MYSRQCTADSVQQCAAGSVQQAVYSRQCAADSVQQTVYSRQCTADSVQQAVYSRQCTADSIQSGFTTDFIVCWPVYFFSWDSGVQTVKSGSSFRWCKMTMDKFAGKVKQLYFYIFLVVCQVSQNSKNFEKGTWVQPLMLCRCSDCARCKLVFAVQCM